MSRRRIIDQVLERYKWELDILREYDRTGRLPSREEVEKRRRARRDSTTQ